MCFCVFAATKHSCIRGLKNSKIQRFKDSKIQGFNFSEAGIGFKKKNIRAFVAKRIQRFKDSKIQKIQEFKNSKIQFRQDGYRIQKISCGFLCFGVPIAIGMAKDSKIQGFKKKYSCIRG